MAPKEKLETEEGGTAEAVSKSEKGGASGKQFQ